MSTIIETDCMGDLLVADDDVEVKHADHDQSSHGNWALALTKKIPLTGTLMQTEPRGSRPRARTDVGENWTGAAPIRGASYEAREEALRDVVSGDVVGIRRMAGGAQGLQVVEFDDGRVAMLRPAESMVQEVGAASEWAATQVARALGIGDMVPAVQMEFRADGRVHGMWREGVPDLNEQVDEMPAAVWVFDRMIENGDRSAAPEPVGSHNIGTDGEGRVVAFDHGHSMAKMLSPERSALSREEAKTAWAGPHHWQHTEVTAEDVADVIGDFDGLRSRLESLRAEFKTMDEVYAPDGVDQQIDWMLGLVDGVEQRVMA